MKGDLQNVNLRRGVAGIAEQKSLRPTVLLLGFIALLLTACGGNKSATSEPFIGENTPPEKQEFRWSNGRMPKSLDPARAASAPETDVVRAIYEGLTDIDAKTLKPIPALAIKWTASEDFRTWTFQLRRDARWTNEKPVTARDFITSWKRLTELGDKVPNRSLLKNIVGMDSEDVMPIFADEAREETEGDSNGQPALKDRNESNSNGETAPQTNVKNKLKSAKSKFGVVAINDWTLKIDLVHPDQDFPLLVAHPLFRPVFGDGRLFESVELNPDIVTNGAFRIKSIGKDGISLERSPVYWNRNTVLLEAVKFVPVDNAETALNAYRAGQVDAVTNVNFQPLALKLLQPYKNEFQQRIHSALNFYEFNLEQKPFDDSRVRMALAIAIERERLTKDHMDGATEPALTFLPFDDGKDKLVQSVEKGRKLLAQAGFPNGEGFPTIKLVVNRNDVQQKIARSIAQMWLRNLGVKTEIIVKDQVEMRNVMETGDFSLVRRGVVLPTNDETSNMLTLFHETKIPSPKTEGGEFSREDEETGALSQIAAERNPGSDANSNKTESSPENNGKTSELSDSDSEPQVILTQDQALEQIPAIPLYFPTSYSLVKPYVKGFELNPFDAVSLKTVQIKSDWQPTDTNEASK